MLHKLDLTTSRTQRLLIHSEAESGDAFSAELAEELLAEACACVERGGNGGDLPLEFACLLGRERHTLSCQKPETIRQVIDAGAEQRPDIWQFLKTTTNDIDLTAEVCDDVVAEAVWIEVRSIWRRRFDDWWEERRGDLNTAPAVGDGLLRCGPLLSLCCDVSDSLLNRAASWVSVRPERSRRADVCRDLALSILRVNAGLNLLTNTPSSLPCLLKPTDRVVGIQAEFRPLLHLQLVLGD